MAVKQISKELDFSFEHESVTERCDVDELKIVVFSDLHRGAGDGADDFLRCKRIYNSALDYYNSLEYRLFLLGDAEELWETSLKKSIKTHSDTLLLEKQFVDAGRYLRFYGNHDRALKDDCRLLKPYIGDSVPIRALTLSVCENENELGKLFFTHGDQGDHYGKLFRLALRYLWRGLQDATHISVYLPSRNPDLSKLSDYHLYSWSANHTDNVALIAGHTHHAVFMSETKEDYNKRASEDFLTGTTNPRKVKALRKAMERWLETEDTDIDLSKGVHIPDNPHPTYFNTGCCAFLDGEITALEISDGAISLIKWSGDSGMPVREVLRTTELRSLFERIRNKNN